LKAVLGDELHARSFRRVGDSMPNPGRVTGLPSKVSQFRCLL
jgi:hypothetical protein